MTKNTSVTFLFSLLTFLPSMSAFAETRVVIEDMMGRNETFQADWANAEVKEIGPDGTSFDVTRIFLKNAPGESHREVMLQINFSSIETTVEAKAMAYTLRTLINTHQDLTITVNADAQKHYGDAEDSRTLVAVHSIKNVFIWDENTKNSQNLGTYIYNLTGKISVGCFSNPVKRVTSLNSPRMQLCTLEQLSPSNVR